MIARRGVAQSINSAILGAVGRSRHTLPACALLALALCAACGARAALWVSADGDDANPGTADRPLRTIARARDIVRGQNRDMSDDITVFISGVHRLTAPLVFTPEDSATNGYSIVYTAAPGEHPVISGGLQVTGWACADKARNLWSAPAPRALQDGRALFVNGSRAQRARARLPQAPADAPRQGAGEQRPPQWRNPGDVIVLAPAPDAVWSDRAAGAPVYAENALEFMGTPGDWYFDRAARTVYYIPRPGEDLAGADVEVAVAPALVEVAGLRNRPVAGLVFKGLRFEFAAAPPREAEGAAVMMRLAGSAQFLEDSFVHLTESALELGPGMDGAVVEGCVFGDVSWGALRIAWASQVRVSDCRFSYASVERPDGAVVALSHCDSADIEHNQVDHFPGSSIVEEGCRPGSCRIAMNVIGAPAIGPDRAVPEERAAPGQAAGVTDAYASILGVRLFPPSAPRPPSAVSADPQDGFAYVTWDPPSLDGGAEVTSYVVASSSGARLTVPAAQFLAQGYVLFAGLENGRAVSFTVSAVSANGAGPASVPSARVVPAHRRWLKVPKPPPAASVTVWAGGSTVRITPAGPAALPVVAYSLTDEATGASVLLEGRDVIRADADHVVARRIAGFAPAPGSSVAVRAVNAKGTGDPLEVRAQR